MKGIAHFISGVAAASFCPWSVQAAVDGNPLYFILGGIFGILPDTLDFKFYRFFYRHDIRIEPSSLNPDPQAIADKIAEAVGKARNRKKPLRLKLSTIRVGADYWQQYSIRFDEKTDEVVVQFGPVVNTGQVPIPEKETKEKPVGRAKLPCPVVQTYDATTRVDIFDGPSFGLEDTGNGKIMLHFLPWHRNWSHSLIMGALFAIVGWAIFSWQAAVVIVLGYSVHVLEDQLGHMGSNLFFPVTRKERSPGLQVMHSGDAMPNFTTVWLSCLFIFWNLYRFSAEKLYHFGFFHFILVSAVIPLGVYGVLHWLLTRKQKEDAGPIENADEWGETT